MVSVRVATLADLEAVIDIGTTTWWATYPPIAGDDYVVEGLARWWTPESTRPGIEAGRVRVAEESGRPVGMASYSVSGPVIDLWKLYVLPDAQGTGAGSALLASVVEAAAPEQTTIRLAHKDGNARARAFYERKGFVETGRSPDEIGGPDNVWMELQLRR